MKLFPAIVSTFVLCAMSTQTSALEFFTSSSLNITSQDAASTLNANLSFADLSLGFHHDGGGFRFGWELGVSGEGEYPSAFMSDYYKGLSVEIREAGLSFKKNGFGFALGKMENRDMVDSPYSLFVSGFDRKTMLAEISYEDDRVFFSDRWLGLNHNLSTTGLYVSGSSSGNYIYRDRGAVIKNYGFKLGRFRFGFQDALVFTGNYFDIDIFANLAPGFFVQYLALATGRPWTESGNQNSLLGFFADYAADRYYVYGQILVDDLNVNRFMHPELPQNPDKIALSVGGSTDTAIGLLGFYLAGATKYTFESIDHEYYSYTYYPASAVVSGTSTVGIPLGEEMIGYSLGENNIAFKATWAGSFDSIRLEGSLELSLSGSKSPANPWHELNTWSDGGQGTKWLDDGILEKRAVLSFGAERHFGPIAVSASGGLGWVQNRLELTAVSAPYISGNLEPVWNPSMHSGVVAELQLKATVLFAP